jgi:predicted AAA+ superfamily ATPase
MHTSTSRRYLESAIRADSFSKNKITLISGPRQVGKTTLSKAFLNDSDNYFSYDQESFRRAWAKSPEAAVAHRSAGPVVLDEIHKDRLWKRKLKGIYDEHPDAGPYIVTGSARLDLFRRGSDSLLGRYLPYRLHPLSVGERAHAPDPDHIFRSNIDSGYPLKDLLNLGGFPEPFFAGNRKEALRWSRLRLDRLVQEDTRDILMVSDLNAFGVLTDLLPERVGSPLSINALREDVGKAYATVRSWYHVLEALYFCFSIKPYHRRINRAVRAEPKMYLFDILRIPESAPGARLENITALHLLKACHYWTDTACGEFDLHFVRDKSKREVDFLVTRDKFPWMLVECKSGLKEPSSSLRYFSEVIKPKYSIQLVAGGTFDKQYVDSRIRVMDYERFLRGLP